jgi:hypothetical protein
VRVPAAVLVLVFGSTPARADELDEARKLEASLEYERALVLIDNAIAHGGFEAGRLADLHFEAGKLAAGLDHADAAQNHFARALAIVPSLALPAGTSPKIVAPFGAARAQPHALVLQHYWRESQVIVTADPDPLHLVAGVQVRVLDATGRREELSTHDGPPFTIHLLTPAKRLEVRALDEHGNTLYLAEDGGEGIVDVIGPWLGGSPPPPWYSTWRIAPVAAIGAVAAFGGFSAWRESVAQDEWNRLRNDSVAHDYSQLRAVEARGNSWALAADISFGLAGSAALVATLWWITDRSAPPVVLTARPGTVGVAGRF